MVALDAAPCVVEAALATSCQLLVTHHPLIFTPLKTISYATPPGKQLCSAICGGLAVVSMHTNYDSADGGLNDLLAQRLGVSSLRPLRTAAGQELLKLVVFVPADHLDALRDALLPCAETLGSYRDCSFSAAGEGTFTPLPGAEPFVGSIGVRERVSEARLEVLINRQSLSRAVKALLAAHPYEEPAFDVYPLLNERRTSGPGRIGTIAEPMSLKEFAAVARESLAAPGLRYVGNPTGMVKKVALCSGSGASLLHDAVRAGADVLVTGDVKYHEARNAEELGIALIDAGHFPTEIIMAAAVAHRLERLLGEAGYDGCQVTTCSVETDPFRV